MTTHKLRVTYEHSRDYQLRPVTGVYGGLTPTTQDIHIAFYCDHGEVPSESAYEIDERTQIATETFSHERAIRREIQFAALMNPTCARSIGEWLIKKAELAESQVDKSQE